MSTPSYQSSNQGTLSDEDIQHIIIRLILETDEDGYLRRILKDIEIADELGKQLEAAGCKLSPQTILAKHRKAAVAAGLVKLQFLDAVAAESSLDEKKRELQDLYGLEELEVEPLGDEKQTPGHAELSTSLGKLAADLFCRILGEGTLHQTVAFGGGQTMHEMVANLPPLKGVFTTTATNFATQAPDGKIYDSSNLAMQVHWRAPDSKVNVCALPPLPDGDHKYARKMHHMLFTGNKAVREVFHNSTEPHVVFMGVGDFNRTSLVIERVYKYLGCDAEELLEFQLVGDINLCLFDKEGKDLTPEIAKKKLGLGKGTLFPDEPHCHPILIGLNLASFQHLVEGGKKVIIVAGGGQKTDALHALLNARPRCVNGLVTDEGMLHKLLARAKGGDVSSPAT